MPEPRTAERALARTGELLEAPVVFTQGAHLPLAGLLLILPAVAATGLVEAFEATYGRLRNGFYGLRATLLMLLFLALLREPRAEGATRIRPADLGRLLGLDRAPEVKTLRRKLTELAGHGRGAALQATLARAHAQARPEALGFLARRRARAGVFGELVKSSVCGVLLVDVGGCSELGLFGSVTQAYCERVGPGGDADRVVGLAEG